MHRSFDFAGHADELGMNFAFHLALRRNNQRSGTMNLAFEMGVQPYNSRGGSHFAFELKTRLEQPNKLLISKMVRRACAEQFPQP
jgi:hypothetical protein